MPIKDLERLEGSDLTSIVRRKDLSLWILPGVSTDDLTRLLSLPWINIWNAAPNINFVGLLESGGGGRKPLIISRPEQDYPTFRTTEFVRVYDIFLEQNANRRRQRFVERLKDQAELLSGILCFVGDFETHFEELSLVRDLAPGITIIIIKSGSVARLPDTDAEFFRWTKGANAFAYECAQIGALAGDSSKIDLKDALGLQVDARLLEDIESQWTLLDSSMVVPPAKLTQAEFDDFLNGEEAWPAVAAGAPLRRSEVCFRCGCAGATRREDFIQIVLEKAKALESLRVEPIAQLEQLLVFSESGSGTTTLLRQAAMALAEQGLPTLISKPFPKDFGGRSLEEFIVDVQNRWLKQRRGKGTGAGIIPVCLLIDTDGEAALGEGGIARSLQALGRKILIVRAMERSRDEIDRAEGPYAVVSEVTSNELVAIGAHLRSVAESYGLERMPTDAEWRAFHEGLESLRRYKSVDIRPEYLSIPSLFLIGISPFVKERIADENSLEQYYYRKWEELENKNAQGIVRILAAAGVYGLSVPFETLRRHPEFDVMELNALHKSIKRILDIFVQWSRRGQFTQDWFLHSRHSAIAAILSKMIDPGEEPFPFTALLPLLENLSTKESDLWFAQTIAFRLGQHFKSRSARFSLETDTAPQRAARAIFNSIPDDVKAISRTVRHHQGRYHIHALRACTDCLKSPHLTALSRDQVEAIARKEFASATEFLEMAILIEDQGESISHIFNTLATAQFALAEAFRIIEPGSVQVTLDEGLDYEDRALKHDAGNGHALYQYVRQIVATIGDISRSDLPRNAEMLARAELRLVELVRLHQEKRWRNVDPIEAEKQLGGLVQDHISAITRVLGRAKIDVDFKATHPEAILFLQVRQLIGDCSLEAAYRKPEIAKQLRVFRNEMENMKPRSTRSDLYLYRLFLADPEGRLEFKARLGLLQKLKREDQEQFSSFAHDEAALYCQLDQLDIGAQKLAELRQYRRFGRDQWFWLNERSLIEPSTTKPRELTLQVTDHIGGWAKVLNTNVRVKFQPYQFGELKAQQVFTAYIRFTLNSLQAVTKDLATRDIEEMGLA